MNEEKDSAVDPQTEEDGVQSIDADTATEEDQNVDEALFEARAEINLLKDKLLRVHADMDNLRKRNRRDVEDAGKYAVERFATALLDVADNMERALDTDEGGSDALREGVQLTLNAWHETMRKFGIERVEALRKIFDPHLHEALMKTVSDTEAGIVIAQHAVGYTLHGRLLRPARVVVSSGPETHDDAEIEA